MSDEVIRQNDPVSKCRYKIVVAPVKLLFLGFEPTVWSPNSQLNLH